MKRRPGQDSARGNSGGQTEGCRLDGIGRERQCEPPSADGDAALGKQFAQSFNRVAYAFLGGILRSAQALADFAQIAVLEKPEENRRALGRLELFHCFLQQGFDLVPDRGVGIHISQFHGKLFAELAARFAAHDIDGGSACYLVQPGREDGVGLQSSGTTRQIRKD